MLWIRCTVFVALGSSVSCGVDDANVVDAAAESSEPTVMLSSGAPCVADNMLTYASFGRAFFAEYCLSCHTRSITGSARQAPLDRNFDDLPSIRHLSSSIDQQAAAGPVLVHQVMPPAGYPAPSIEQREQLGTWLACGAPE